MGMMIILLLGNKVNLHFLYFCDEIMLEIMEKLKYVDLNFFKFFYYSYIIQLTYFSQR